MSRIGVDKIRRWIRTSEELTDQERKELNDLAEKAESGDGTPSRKMMYIHELVQHWFEVSQTLHDH